MRIKHACLMLTFAILAGCAELPQLLETGTQVSQSAGYSPAQLNKAVKQSLELSAVRASETLGQAGGYSGNDAFRLTLPKNVQAIVEPLKQFGLGSQIDRIESLMNQGAERAAGEAKDLLVTTVRNMSVENAIGIVRGGDTAATDYFRAQTQEELRNRYGSIMQEQLQKLGFYSQYQQLLSAYKLLPLADKPNLDLEEHAVDQGLQALYQQIAQEEQKIRANPVEQGTALIAAVFGK